MNTKSPYFTIVGNIGATNVGDEAIFLSTAQILRETFPSCHIHTLSFTPQETAKQYKNLEITTSPFIPLGIRSALFKTKSFLKSIKALKKTTHVILGGGGLFTDKSSIRAVLLWWAHARFFQVILRKPVHIFAQTIGPLSSPLAQSLTRKVLSQAESITVRDRVSLSCIQELKGIPKAPSLLPDPALLIQTGAATKERIYGHIALSLRPWESIEHHINSILTTITEHKPKHVHLIAMQTIKESDLSILTSFLDKLPSEIQATLHTPHTYKEVLDILTTCELLIGMRLHALILGIISQTPIIALAYSTKVTSLLEDLGLEDFMIPIEELTHQNLSVLYKRDKTPQKQILIAYKNRQKKERLALKDHFQKIFT